MQENFEHFPFRLGGSIAPSDMIAREKKFVPTTRIQEVVEEIIEVPPPPTFSEAELAAAKQEGYRKGFDEGEKTGKAFADSELAKLDQAVLALIPTITKKTQQVFTHYNQFVLEQKQVLPTLSLAIAKKLYGGLPPEHLLDQVVTHTTECVEKMLGTPELHIYVHPDFADNVEARLTKHFATSHEPGDVLIHKDDSIALTDCRVEWHSGGMEYKHGMVAAKLETLVDGLSQSATINHQDALPAEEVVVNNAVAEAIADQHAQDEIPPIPGAPVEPNQTAAPSPTTDEHK